jgi:hypothetical protein
LLLCFKEGDLSLLFEAGDGKQEQHVCSGTEDGG